MKYARIVDGVVDALSLDRPMVPVEKTRQVKRTRLVPQDGPLVDSEETPPEPILEEFEETETHVEYEPEPGWLEVGDTIFAGFLFDGKNFTPPAPDPQPRQTVLKSVVQSRIIAAGKMPQAYAALTSNPINFARWFAPDRPAVYCDDPDAVGLVQALGLDPAVILAP